MRLRGGLLLLTSISFLSVAAQNASVPQHAIEDWSTRHVVFTGLTPENVSEIANADPRAWSVWLKHGRYKFRPEHSGKQNLTMHGNQRHADRSKLKKDWQMPIGSNAPEWASPAKFGFNVNDTPDCVNDYVVFPTANTPVPGTSGPGIQSSLIAFNNLYTGPGPTGICPTPTLPAAQPSVLFAYNTATVSGGQANLSPVLSLDGKKIAFTENTSSSTVFHVLTWVAGEGSISSAALPGDCSAGHSCMTSLVLNGSPGNTLSNPFVDYAHDTAYVGDAAGLLHKVIGVFNGTPQEAIGSGWPVQLLSPPLESPVYDSVSGFVFVPDRFVGALHIVDGSSGLVVRTISIPSLALSDVIVDSINQTVFIFFWGNPSDQLTVDQFDTSGTLLAQVAVGSLGGIADEFTGAFDHAYYTDPSSGSLYFAGDSNFIASLYRVGFTGTVMNSTAFGPLLLSSNPSTSEPTRLTEFYNPSFSPFPDRLFVPIEEKCVNGGSNTDGCIESLDITNGLPSGILNRYTFLGFHSPPPMTGVIVDNVSSLPQASSIYFEATTDFPSCTCAIKLTQSALQ